MKGQDEPLVFVFSNEPGNILVALGSIPHVLSKARIQVCSPGDFSTAGLPAHAILIVDFVSQGPSTVEFARLLPAGIPVLGLVPQRETASRPDDWACCTEAVAWPGDIKELVAKLARMARHLTTDRMLERTLTLKLNLVGESEAFRRVTRDIEKYAKCAAPVLIIGETGTGKEEVARAIHYLGLDDGKPFVAVNCGALPDSLIENELFGHVKGAYTDAKESQCGLIEQAEGGTLFLDEIEALTLKGQVTLLRFLQDYEYRPLGAQRSKKARLRMITASNEPLEQLVNDGVFRKDLYYRLNILALQIPPLRERGGDVVLLAEYFVDKFREIYRQHRKYICPDTLQWLTRYDWPGNVRELENMILREFLLADSACISIEPFSGVTGERRKNGPDRRARHLFRRNFQDAKAAVIDEFERRYLKQVLDDAKGNISAAARQAGKERRTFAKLLDKHDIGRGQ